MQITKFAIIGGCDGRKNGSKIAYSVIDAVIAKEILQKYSWTGISKDKDLPEKIAFNAYKGIIIVIFEIVRKSDDRWTLKDTELVFKQGVLKHAKKRQYRDM